MNDLKKYKNTPLVSVVIPCFNQSVFLSDAVDSVIRQTYRPIEVIIVNDGSEDNTHEEAERLQRKYSDVPIKIIRQNNSGLAAARNRGFTESKGELVLPLDCDDKIMPAMIERCVTAISEHGNSSFVYVHQQNFGTNDFLIKVSPYNVSNILNDNCFPYCSMIRKSVWKKAGGYKSNMKYGYEDWDFWITLWEHQQTGFMVDEPLFLYRVRENSMISTARKHDTELRAQIVINHPTLFSRMTKKNALNISSETYSNTQKSFFLFLYFIDAGNMKRALKVLFTYSSRLFFRR